MKKFLLGILFALVSIALVLGGKYFYDYVNRPLETVMYGSAEELESEVERLESIKESGRISWREKYKLGVSYHQIMRYNDAVLVLGDFVKDKPEVGKAHETLGMSYYRLGKLEEAVRSWEMAKTAPNRSSSSNSSMDLMISDVKRTITLRSRIKELESKIKQNEDNKEEPSKWGEKFELALLYMGVKEPDKALVHLEELSVTRKEDADIHATLAQVYAMTGEFLKAYDSMKKASILQPDEEEFKLRLAELGKLKKAVKSGEFHKESTNNKN